MQTVAPRVLYPRYFSSNAKKTQGRRVARQLCVASPTLAEIQAVVEQMGFEAEADAKKRYPRSTVDESEMGYLKVACIGVSKEELLRRVGGALVEMRTARQVQASAEQKGGKKGGRK